VLKRDAIFSANLARLSANDISGCWAEVTGKSSWALEVATEAEEVRASQGARPLYDSC
jgi:hypothetical protein